MSSNLNKSVILMLATLGLAACQGESQDGETRQAGAQEETAAAPETAATDEAMPVEHTLEPLPGMEDQAPEITQKTTILLQTTAGDITVDVYPEAAPNAAARFVELVESGYYDNVPVSRVVPGFVAQFGINWREGHREWQNNTFSDDPTLFSLDPGTLAFAKAGPDTNSTQVFINYVNNNRLASPEYNFTVFAKVVEGMDVVEQFQQVGHPSNGLDQGRLWTDGEAYLAEQPVTPTYIENAEVIDQ